MTTFHIVFAHLPFVLYVLAAVLTVRAVRRAPGQRSILATAAAQLGALLHAWVLFGAIRTPNGVVLAITDSASLVGWVVAATTAIAMAFLPLAALPAALLIVAGLLASGTGLVSGFREIHEPMWELNAHISLAALAAGWLTIAATVVLLLAWQDTRIRTRRPLGILALLPPVETMETTLFRALGAGFAVLTLALLTGLFFVTNAVAQHLAHKIALALVAWVVFGVLLIGRVRYGWRGRKALRFTIVGFVALALAYFGSKFVLETLLGRHWG